MARLSEPWAPCSPSRLSTSRESIHHHDQRHPLDFTEIALFFFAFRVFEFCSLCWGLNWTGMTLGLATWRSLIALVAWKKKKKKKVKKANPG